MSRGVAAALLAAGLVLSGCVSVDADGTVTSAPPEAPVNPWELPLEERPDLFDPCAEIPVEAVEEGVGSRLEPVQQFQNYRSGELITCGWKNDEIHISVLSTWKSREEFLVDRTVSTIQTESLVAGRPSLQMKESSDHTGRSCLHLFFTGVGAVMIKLDLVNALREFNGEQFTVGCTALDSSIGPIVPFIPAGSN